MRISGKHWDDSLRAEIVRRLSVPGASASRVAAEMGLRKASVMDLARRMRESNSSEVTPPYQETVKPRHRVPYRKADPDQFSTYEQIHGKKETEKAGVPFTMPEGHVLKGVSALVDGEGKEVLRWVKTREDLSVADIVETIREAFKDFQPRASGAPEPTSSDGDLATIYPLADWHLGLLTWKQEVGQNWDLSIARDTILGAARRLVECSPSSEKAVVLGLGDLLHADGYDNATPKSKNVLDIDGRYPKILKTAVQVVIAVVNFALERHRKVEIRILSGNHDPESSIAVALALATYYQNDPRVTVDDDPSYFWWWSWGTTLLGATHGDAAKMKDLPLLMAVRNPEAWGKSKFRYIYTGHIHTQTGIEMSGVTVESFQTPAVADAWHSRMGYGANRSLSSITLHKDFGEISRQKVNII